MGIYRCVWVCVGIYEYVYVYMSTYGFVWVMCHKPKVFSNQKMYRLYVK